MKMLSQHLVGGLLLAVILRTSGHQAEAGQELESRYTDFDFDELNKCIKSLAITTGSSCRRRPVDPESELDARILDRIFKAGMNKSEYEALPDYAKAVLKFENKLVEDYININVNREMCYHQSQCNNGTCMCENITRKSYQDCVNHKQMVIDCTLQADIARLNWILHSRVAYLAKADCAKKSMAGKGEQCSNTELEYKYYIDFTISRKSHLRFNAQDWEQKIKQTCVSGKCDSSGVCKCPSGDTMCAIHKKQDLDAKCKAEVEKTVKCFAEYAKLRGSSEGSSTDRDGSISPGPPRPSPPQSAKSPKKTKPASSTTCATTPFVILFGILMSLAPFIS